MKSISFMVLHQKKEVVLMDKNHHIVVSPVTYNALSSLAKYRDTMDDIVLKVVVSYATAFNIVNEPITYAMSEYKKRFGEGDKQ